MLLNPSVVCEKKKQKKLTLASVDKEETGLQTVMNGGPERRRSSAGGCSEGGGSLAVLHV